MGDGSLSQEEFDALLNMGGDADAGSDPEASWVQAHPKKPDSRHGLAADDLSALTSSAWTSPASSSRLAWSVASSRRLATPRIRRSVARRHAADFEWN